MAPIVEPVSVNILRGLLIPLSLILVWGFGAAFAHSAIIVARAMFGTAEGLVGWIPWLGGKVKGKIEHVSERFANFMGGLAAKADHRVGMALHDIANLARATYDAIVEIAVVSAETTVWLVKKVGVAALGPRLSRLTQTTHVATKAQAQVNRRTRADHAAVTHAKTGPIGAAITAKTAPLTGRVERLEHNVSAYAHALPLPQARALPGELEGLRARTKAAERTLGRLWDRVRGVDHRLAGLGAVALVGTMVARLGAGWIFCRNWRKVGRSVCRTDASLLDDLLGLTLAVVGTISIVEFAEELQAVIGEVADDVHRLIREK